MSDRKNIKYAIGKLKLAPWLAKGPITINNHVNCNGPEVRKSKNEIKVTLPPIITTLVPVLNQIHQG
jgi:hypothetical protein